MNSFTPSSDFRRQVERWSGESIAACYQCGKCTAGCPAVPFMDGGPRWLFRAIQLGLREEVLTNSTPWFCLHCAACFARCPAGIDIPRVMDAVRQMAVAAGKKPASREVAAFHRLFLGQVEGWGRINELSLGAGFNLLGGHPFQNLSLLPWMLRRGKLLLLPRRSARVKELADRVRRLEKGDGDG